MGSLKDIPYSKLKESNRAYEMMIFCDLNNDTYTEVAKKFGVSLNIFTAYYCRMKIQQLQLYVNHLAIVHGHENTEIFQKLLNEAYDCYRDYKYITAYFEKKYTAILLEYRAGEPGLPEGFLKELPPFKENCTKHIMSRVVFLREDEKNTFAEIGKDMKMTAKSAEWLYQNYYFQKFMKISEKIMAKTGEKDIRKKYFSQSLSGKKQYESICRDYPDYRL